MARSTLAGCPSGQWEGTVNPPALPSKVQILHPPPALPLKRGTHVSDPRNVFDSSYHDDPIDFTKPSKKKRPSFLAFMALLLGGGLLVQTTLAANVSIGSGAPLEFGQGVQQTTACSGSTPLTITPRAAFSNASGSGSYKFDAITVSGIPSSCYGVDFTLNAYGNSDNVALALFDTTTANVVVYNNAGTFEPGVNSTGTSVTSGSGTFTVTFIAPVALSGSIYRLTIQSGKHSPFGCVTGGECAVGDRGPGGGIVYYVSATPFTSVGSTCGNACRFLEYAPAGWNNSGVVGLDAWVPRWATNTANLTGQNVSAAGSQGSVFVDDMAGGSITEKTNWAIGAGKSNTNFMLGTNGSYTPDLMGAAYLANRFAGTDSSAGQWFVPSVYEMNELCKYVRGQATGVVSTACANSGSAKFGTNDDTRGFSSTQTYDTSSEISATHYVGFYFGDSSYFKESKMNASYAVRPIRAF